MRSLLYHWRHAGVVAILFAAIIVAWFPGIFLGEAITVTDALFARPPWETYRPHGYPGPSNKLLFDQVVQVYPWLDYARERLRAGELPLWNPYDACGTPFLANQNAGVLTPIHLVTLPLANTATALTAIALLKLLIAFIGAARLAGSFGASPVASLLAGSSFALGGQVSVWLGHPLTTATVWLPWSLLFAEHLVRDGATRLRAGWLALITLFHMLGSHPESSLHVVILTGLFALLRLHQIPLRPRPLKRVAAVIVTVTLGVIASAAQLVPFAEALESSHARTLRQSDRPSNFALPIEAIPLILAPLAYGTPMSLDHREDLLRNHNFAESALFAGVLPLILIPAAWPTLRRIPQARTLAFLAAGSLLIAFDPFGVFSPVLRRIPLLGLGAHHRLTLVWQLGLGVLLALAVDSLCHSGRAVATTAAKLSAGLAVAVLAHTAHRLGGAGAMSPPVLAGLIGAGALAMIGAGIAHRRNLAAKPSPSLLPVVLAFLLIDLWHFGHGVNPTTPQRLVFPSTAATDWLKQATTAGRVIGVGRALPANTGLAYRIPDARGYEPLFGDDYQRLWSQVMTPRGAWDQVNWSDLRAPRVLPLFGVSYVVDQVLPTANDDSLRVVHQGDATIHERSPGGQMAFLAHSFEIAKDIEEIGTRLRDGYPFDQQVLLLQTPRLFPTDPPATAVERTRYSRPAAESIAIRVEVSADALLVVSESFASGWEVTVDGQPSELIHPFGVFLGTTVPSGAHDVEFRYRPLSVRIGLMVSAVGILLIGFLLFSARGRAA